MLVLRGKSQLYFADATVSVSIWTIQSLGTILSAYKDLSERVAIVDSGLPAIDMVRKAVSGRIGRFTKQDILSLCPSLSLSSVEGALRKLVEMGEIEREGVSRAIKYKRLT